MAEAKVTIKADDQATASLKKLADRFKALSPPLKNLGGGFSSLVKTLRRNSTAADTNTSRFKHLADGFKKLGAGTLGLTFNLARLGLQTAKTSKTLGTLAVQKIAANFAAVGRNVAGLSNSLREFGGHFMETTAKVTAAAAALAYGFKRLFVDAAAGSEEFGRQLSNALDDKELGAEALKSLRRFSSQTGRELGEATAAFAALAEGGIKPTEKHLSALADMAAKKNKTLAETGDAFKRALKGEAGALEEWGIKSEARGKHMLYQYTDQAGQLVKLAAKANDPKALARLLDKVALDKAAGAEKERGQTFGGGLAKLTAKWAEFRNMVMDSGPFQFLKGELANILSWVEKLEKDGSLAKLAKQWGGKLTGALKTIKEELKIGWEWLNKWGPKGLELVNTFGGFKTVAMGLSLVLGGPLLGAFGGLVKSVGLFGKALALTPVGLLVTAGTALAAVMHKAGVLTPLLDGLGEGFGSLGDFADMAAPLFHSLASAFGVAGDAAQDVTGHLSPQDWKALGVAIGDFTNGALKDLIDMLAKVIDFMGKVAEKSGQVGEWLADFTGPDLKGQDKALADLAAAKKNGDTEAMKRILGRAGYGKKEWKQTTPRPNYSALSSLDGRPISPFGNAAATSNLALSKAVTSINDMRKQETVTVTVKLEGTLPPGVTAAADTSSPQTTVSDRTRQSMGFRNGIL